MAMAVLGSETVDADTWSEAVQWLLLYGSESVKTLLLDASSTATSVEFPDLRPEGYTTEGEPVYSLGGLAQAMGTTVDDLEASIKKVELEEDIPLSPADIKKLN